jgi:enamine deaminase RidA (YjgF/YER057c/UK114 family)
MSSQQSSPSRWNDTWQPRSSSLFPCGFNDEETKQCPKQSSGNRLARANQSLRPCRSCWRFVVYFGDGTGDEKGNTVGNSDITVQARQVHENLKKYLAAAGATFADVCKVTVYVRTSRTGPLMKYVSVFWCESTRQHARLANDDFDIEIEAIARCPE